MPGPPAVLLFVRRRSRARPQGRPTRESIVSVLRHLTTVPEQRDLFGPSPGWRRGKGQGLAGEWLCGHRRPASGGRHGEQTRAVLAGPGAERIFEAINHTSLRVGSSFFVGRNLTIHRIFFSESCGLSACVGQLPIQALVWLVRRLVSGGAAGRSGRSALDWSLPLGAGRMAAWGGAIR